MKQITRDKGTHSNYRLNDNHNDKHNKYKNYKDDHKRRTKECSAVYVKCIQTTKECVRQEGRSSENEREECRKRERGHLWLSTREKFSPYRKVGHAANMHNNEEMCIRDRSRDMQVSTGRFWSQLARNLERV